MLRRETLVLTRALNTFSPLLSTSAMQRPRLSSRSNAVFRSSSSGSTAASIWGRDADAAAAFSVCCLLADRRLARDIHRMRSATHQTRGTGHADAGLVVTITCLGVVPDGVLPNLPAGEGIQHGGASTSTRAVAAATERQDTPENTAADADATAAAASTTAAAMAAASAGRSAGGAGGAFAATARAADAIRGRSRPDRRSARAADASLAGSSLRSAARASAWSAASATSADRKLPCASARRRKSSSSRSASGDRPRRRRGSCACGWWSRSERETSTRPSCSAPSATASAEACDTRRPTRARRSATSSSSWSTSGWNRHGRLADRARYAADLAVAVAAPPAGGVGDLGAGKEIVRRNPATIPESLIDRWINSQAMTAQRRGSDLKGKVEWGGDGMERSRKASAEGLGGMDSLERTAACI
nr:unnamed protein product [Digitaria exilis]